MEPASASAKVFCAAAGMPATNQSAVKRLNRHVLAMLIWSFVID